MRCGRHRHAALDVRRARQSLLHQGGRHVAGIATVVATILDHEIDDPPFARRLDDECRSYAGKGIQRRFQGRKALDERRELGACAVGYASLNRSDY